jgi:hypothetical protein
VTRPPRRKAWDATIYVRKIPAPPPPGQCEAIVGKGVYKGQRCPWAGPFVHDGRHLCMRHLREARGDRNGF